jgi:hypothetical protein
MKLKYQNGQFMFTHRRPYERFSPSALLILLSHAKAGSEECEVIEREVRFRKKEPKQDLRQTLLFTGLEWEQTKSPWCHEVVGQSGWNYKRIGVDR